MLLITVNMQDKTVVLPVFRYIHEQEYILKLFYRCYVKYSVAH